MTVSAPLPEPPVCRLFRPSHVVLWAGLALAVVLSGCSSSPPKVAPAPLVSTVPPLEQFMSDAARARQEGARAVERETYRKAAQAYPTSKEPWLKLAEGYFEAADYGNAILAAQEVLQRDDADRMAGSLLAVSGLRVSSRALASLRQGQDLSADTRRQAEDMVKTLREALGETVLVPPPQQPAAAPASAASPPVKRPAGTAPASPAVRRNTGPAAPPAAPAPAPPPAATPAGKKPADPFKGLN